MKRLPINRTCQVAVLVFVLTLIVAGIAMFAGGKNSDLKAENERLREQIEVEHEVRDSLSTVISSLESQVAKTDSTIVILAQEREQWRRAALANDVDTEAIINESFSGTDSTLAALLYKQLRAREDNR